MKRSNLIATKYGMDRLEKPPRSSIEKEVYCQITEEYQLKSEIKITETNFQHIINRRLF
ncbi:hypothetical protein [Vibrio splendidus]|uniref:hypothetical protein n=1 Tax=Vibrio splendidus TaxID=29497 RepID=UPI0012FFF84C|nr:hypothetical protein [Vibrio splendidus]